MPSSRRVLLCRTRIADTFVSLAKTLPAGLVKEQVGHSSNMDTFGVYGHFVNTDQEHLGIALETVFSTIEK